ARGQQTAPTPHSAPDIQDATPCFHLQPWREREALFQMDGLVVKLGHPVGADRGQTVPFGGEPSRPILPVEAGAVMTRRRKSSHAHSSTRSPRPRSAGGAGGVS